MGLPVQGSWVSPSLAPPRGPVKHCSTSHLGGCCVPAQPGGCAFSLPSWSALLLDFYAPPTPFPDPVQSPAAHSPHFCL